MPELPEVEVTRRRIRPLLVGRTIARVRTTRPSYLFLTPPGVLRRRLPGRRIAGLARQGKYLLAGFEDGSRLVIHLGMTGQLFAEGAASPRLLSATARAALLPDEQLRFQPDGHTHLRLAFRDPGPEILLRDVRKFGKVLWLSPGEGHERLDRLGVDALRLRGEDLESAARGRKAAIKSLLLDQAVVAGSGNIYADEALALAGVRPTRQACRVSRKQCERIAEELRRVMRRAIETGGSSISDFVAPDGSDGGYQDERRVYARTGAPCLECGAAIRRVLIGQRSAHYCPRCQR
ncbi:MAG: bifunctional DNA-formamidopyrimidine glycosylase/DNA-(apurinic or apyrimidinic site) lyase [Myxococcota bacterium]